LLRKPHFVGVTSRLTRQLIKLAAGRLKLPLDFFGNQL
jgi:hypothetical protein